MILSLHPLILADKQIIPGPRPVDSVLSGELAGAEAIILPQSCSEALYRAAESSGAVLFPCYGPRFAYPGKSGQARMFADLGFPHPETRCWPSAQSLKAWLAEEERLPHDTPFLIKADFTHEGEGVWMVHRREDLAGIMDMLEVNERSDSGGFVTQRLVPSGGNALRAVIFEKRVLSYWKRAGEGEILATVSRGARVDREWRPGLQAKGRAQAMELRERAGINLAAVDMVFDLEAPDPSPILLEVNYYFGRRGLGGGNRYYRLLLGAVRDWLEGSGFNPGRVRLC